MSQAIEKKVIGYVKKAQNASKQMVLVSMSVKNAVLKKMARALLANKAYLLRENKKDLKAAASQNYPSALVDRLVLNDKRIAGMSECLLDTAKIKDPVGTVIKKFKNADDLNIEKVRTPIGVVGIIYESRPNVTSDCIGLCLKSGNAVVLKGGKEAIYSNKAIFKICQDVLKKSKIPVDAIQLIDSTDRAATSTLLKQDNYVDVIVPRGGEGLINYVVGHSRIPVIKHAAGICHTYVSNKADLKKAKDICINAKIQRPGVCNAMETLLVHKAVAKKFLPSVCDVLIDAGVELRGDQKTRAIIKGVKPAKASDWDTEYLDMILSIKVVENTNEAIAHINDHGSAHSDAIVTKDKKEGDLFLSAVHSACVYVNASTRFTDGYAFGFGAEVGISTDKLHARGPMALEELTTYKYAVRGVGQIRK